MTKKLEPEFRNPKNSLGEDKLGCYDGQPSREEAESGRGSKIGGKELQRGLPGVKLSPFQSRNTKKLT